MSRVNGEPVDMQDFDEAYAAHKASILTTNFSDLILMPKELTAENGAKSLLIGEFHETVSVQCEGCNGTGWLDEGCCEHICEYCTGAGDYALKVTVGWTTIKEIYAMYVKYQQSKLVKQEGK